ncbi:MAG: hypothetical protein KAU46_03335 [Candidatus Aminicenantes bacterium]|nr:hypothetical protein [Candidatus Aminicenantes bacterium]
MFKKALFILTLFTLANCGHVILVPPEIDLTPHKSVGLISFSIENAEGQLEELATQRFLQVITRFQTEIEVIELGTIDEVLGKVNKKTLDYESTKDIGEFFNVASFFYGEIKVSDVKPHIDIAALIRSLRIRASFDISMTSRLFSSETGATLWTDSSDRKGTLAFLSMSKDRLPYFDIRDQDETYKRLIEDLIYDLTRDFRPSKRRVRR